ncbi:hypothetical protein BE21_04105 [Sorangium cellulosum]|uniref:Uncharacterized protein n=1 Tax=Sorangium cellulosum TaxID=56 RepID=A0A150THN3_SORCE|nr:hypothetical protein BE21_04105 [Sorangium cellulosum]
MIADRRRDPGAAGIAALALGLLAAPWVYVTLFRALSAFQTPFVLVATPLLVAATIVLGLEAFSRLRGFRRTRQIAAATSAVVVLTILWALTNFTPMIEAERLGLLATVWLGATLAWLVVSLRVGAVGPEARVHQRLTSPARQRAALATAILLLGALSAISWRYLTTPTVFIGDR